MLYTLQKWFLLQISSRSQEKDDKIFVIQWVKITIWKEMLHEIIACGTNEPIDQLQYMEEKRWMSQQSKDEKSETWWKEPVKTT